ncbi:MAG TPA: sigma-70 family RNA polymerase sigma factor [Isosphaeraceae bacterium]|nr:sigma-70 family RNA polymerase sigma factor [Isosphaeraceae bacterium]
MASETNGAVLRQVDRLFGAGTLAGLSEAQLLERFVARRDEAAFAALVERHGPMVLGVCRRTLADRHDIEDAFQATFLVLVRKAGSIRDREGLAPWLHGVARRVACRARGLAARRRAVEGPGLDEVALAVAATPEAPRSDLVPLLDEEIARLPANDREAIVLCDLQGRPGEEAARLLGLRAVTLRSRLHRARRRLRERLVRRGVAPAALASAWIATSPAPAMELSESTITAAIGFAARPASAGAASARVVALTEGVLKAMLLTKWKVAAVATVALGIAAAGVVAQQPGTPGRPASDEDRLRQVEEKLDRVLRALENHGSAAAPAARQTTAVGLGGNPGVTVAPADLNANPYGPGLGGKPRQTGAPADPTATTIGNVATTGRALNGDTPKYADPVAAQPKGAPPRSGDRLARVERRLDDLERRISRLEQQHAASTVPAGAGTISDSGAAQAR